MNGHGEREIRFGQKRKLKKIEKVAFNQAYMPRSNKRNLFINALLIFSSKWTLICTLNTKSS